jgi:hypothetical protein
MADRYREAVAAAADVLDREGDVSKASRILNAALADGALYGDRPGLAEVARYFVHEADAASDHATLKGGQQVGYHGDFAGVVRLPSGLAMLRRWRELFRAALDDAGKGADRG